MTKFNSAQQSYKAGDFYGFGLNMGEALDELVLKSPVQKYIKDEQAYEFLSGFMDGLLHLPIDRMHIYNRIDGLGHIIMGPVFKIMHKFEQSDPNLTNLGILTDEVWMGFHEFTHIFLGGGQGLIRKQVITQPQLDHINDYVPCLSKGHFTIENTQDVIGLMRNALVYY